MRSKLLILIAVVLLSPVRGVFSQTTLDTAVNFHVKTIDGVPVFLFSILDNDNKIVVIDFFSTSCGPCQLYAPDFQASYEDFGENNGNVYYMGVNWGSDNEAVRVFDSTFNLTYPTISGTQGGGNDVFTNYNILSYPTVIVIVPEDHLIVNQEIVPPVHDSINQAVIAAGGIFVGVNEKNINSQKLKIYPNPTSGKATIGLFIESKSIVSITIFDLLGRKKQRLSSSQYSTGYVSIPLDINDLKDGVYFVRINYNGKTVTRQIIKSSL